MADASMGSSGGRTYDNAPTSIAHAIRPRQPLSFHRLFVQHYELLRRQSMGFPHPGVVIVAVDAYGGGFRGSLSVAAHAGAARSVIVGRHSRADLLLDSDPSLSLRHLAVVLSPANHAADVRLRIIDLRTQTGFEDEHGQRYQSLTTNGSLFVRCGTHVLFVLVTGSPARWPSDPTKGWQELPPRAYVGSEASAGGPLSWVVPDVTLAARGAHTIDSTIVCRIPGPLVARRCMLAPDEEPLGNLLVTTRQGAQVLVVGAQAVQRGVLLGRYARCDVTRQTLLVDDSVSRVHLLVLTLAEGLHAIDTASRNGTRSSDEPAPIRMAPLRPGRPLVLGQGTARVSWKPA